MPITPEHAPSEGTDFWLTFPGLTAGIVGIKGGKATAAKLDRKRLDKPVKFHSPSKLTEITDVVATIEEGTGTIPALRARGDLIIIDAGRAVQTLYSDSYLYDTGEPTREVGQPSTRDLTFGIINVGVESPWTPPA